MQLDQKTRFRPGRAGVTFKSRPYLTLPLHEAIMEVNWHQIASGTAMNKLIATVNLKNKVNTGIEDVVMGS